MKNAEEINASAIKLDLPPNDYSLLEMHLFIVLKEIYKQYYNGKIDKETGAKLKNIAAAQYDQRLKLYNLEQQIYKKHIECIIKTESLRRQLRHEIKNKDKQALNTAIELIGLYSGEFKIWEGVDINEFK